jgi:hypothetical protein
LWVPNDSSKWHVAIRIRRISGRMQVMATPGVSAAAIGKASWQPSWVIVGAGQPPFVWAGNRLEPASAATTAAARRGML